ncbi:hypothetical protein C8R43DRAFT_1210989 [Mycena crocata]|nr:hypothetical protein C8R43DRAFT_1210989 [Mycena crocata]
MFVVALAPPRAQNSLHLEMYLELSKTSLENWMNNEGRHGYTRRATTSSRSEILTIGIELERILSSSSELSERKLVIVCLKVDIQAVSLYKGIYPTAVDVIEPGRELRIGQKIFKAKPKCAKDISAKDHPPIYCQRNVGAPVSRLFGGNNWLYDHLGKSRESSRIANLGQNRGGSNFNVTCSPDNPRTAGYDGGKADMRLERLMERMPVDPFRGRENEAKTNSGFDAAPCPKQRRQIKLSISLALKSRDPRSLVSIVFRNTVGNCGVPRYTRADEVHTQVIEQIRQWQEKKKVKDLIGALTPGTASLL